MGFNHSYLGVWLAALRRRLTPWRKPDPLASLEDVADFVRARASYIAQTTLYGYIKTRTGTRYVSLFEDEVFVASINIAKWRVYLACLDHLSLHAVAKLPLDPARGHGERRALALRLRAGAPQIHQAGGRSRAGRPPLAGIRGRA